jgi:hypothetical protein
LGDTTDRQYPAIESRAQLDKWITSPTPATSGNAVVLIAVVALAAGYVGAVIWAARHSAPWPTASARCPTTEPGLAVRYGVAGVAMSLRRFGTRSRPGRLEPSRGHCLRRTDPLRPTECRRSSRDLAAVPKGQPHRRRPFGFRDPALGPPKGGLSGAAITDGECHRSPRGR